MNEIIFPVSRKVILCIYKEYGEIYSCLVHTVIFLRKTIQLER